MAGVPRVAMACWVCAEKVGAWMELGLVVVAFIGACGMLLLFDMIDSRIEVYYYAIAVLIYVHDVLV